MDTEKELTTARRKMRKAQDEAKAARQRNLSLQHKLAEAEKMIGLLRSDVSLLQSEVVKAESEARDWLVKEGAGRIKWAHDRIDGLARQLSEETYVKPQVRTALALAKQRLDRQAGDEVLACVCKLLEEILSGARG